MKRGFTLVEILVAMSILGVLVLIMAQVFMASNRAWTGGLRQVEMSMEGRAALNLIATELAQAMADDLLAFSIDDNAPRFYTAEDPSTDRRAIKRVRYSRDGAVLRRQVWPVGPWAGDYPVHGAGSGPAELVGNVAQFEVTPSPEWGGVPNRLPNWVDVRLVLEREYGQTVVRAMSYGPGGTGSDSSEWITTW